MFDEIYTYSDIEGLIDEHITVMEELEQRVIGADIESMVEDMHDYCQSHKINFDSLPTYVFNEIVEQYIHRV